MRSLTDSYYVRNLLATGAVVLSLAVGTTTANASDCDPPQSQVYYKTIVVYETVQKACIHWITKYDHCDQPYRVKVVTYKSVQVPVEKRIRVAM